jgi:RNA polymerase primary sigma factor
MSLNLPGGFEAENSNDGTNDRLPVALARAGDREAVQYLIRKFERPVEIIAKRYVCPGIMHGDLVQEGNCGILEAIKGYNPSLGFKFSTYVTWWIRQKISRYCQDHGRTIRIPNDIFYGTKSFERELMAFYAENGRFLTDEEMMAKWDYTANELAVMKEKLRLLKGKTISFDYDPVKAGDDDGIEYELPGVDDGQLAGVIDDVAGEEFLDKLRQVFTRKYGDRVQKKVTVEQEWEIFLDRFGFNDNQCDYSLAELGKRYNLSREGVSHIEDKVLDLINGNRLLLNDLKSLEG